MNNLDYIRTLFDAGFWARDRLLAAAEGMTEEEYARDCGLTYTSLRGILTHVLGAELLYFLRLTGQPAPPVDSAAAVTETNLPTIEAWKQRALEVETLVRSCLDSMTGDDLDSELTYVRRDGVKMVQPRWEVLTQVLQHGIAHRAEAAEALTMAGRSPGDLDFVIYRNSRP